MGILLLLLLSVQEVTAPCGNAVTLKGRVHQTQNDGNRYKAIFGFTWGSFTHVIYKVYDKTPASIVGIQKGDKIIKIIGDNFSNPRSGDIFIFTIRREDKTFDVYITAEDPRDIDNPEIHKIWIKN